MLTDKTKSIQHAFSVYCRTGEATDIPVQSTERLSHYRRLVFNVVKNTLTQAYPIACKLLGEKEWNNLVYRFFADHDCQHPQVWRMPRELIDFVTKSGYHSGINLPHLPELLLLEWLEIEVHTMPDVHIAPFSTALNDIMHEPLRITPYYKLTQFKYPVHKTHQLNPAEHAGVYFVLLFRNDETGKVHFTQIHPPFAVLLDTLIQNPETTATEVLGAVEGISDSTNPTERLMLDKVTRELRALLIHLNTRNFILGKAVS